MKRYLTERFTAALTSLGHAGRVPLTFETPKTEAHGDITTNVAMLLGKAIHANPRTLAQELAGKLSLDPVLVPKVEVAGPGFINLYFAGAFFSRQLKDILGLGETFGRSNIGGGRKTQVEYVSANPTGPLSVGHGRQAAIGDTIANLLAWTDHDVTREYYYNNAGRQMRMLGESTFARYKQIFNPTFPFPDDGYQGDYIKEIAAEVRNQRGESLAHMPVVQALKICQELAENRLFQSAKNVLARMGVVHDIYFNEDSLYKGGMVDEVVQEFRKLGLAYDKEGAIWLRMTELGLDQDRVIVKSTGEPTYRLPDIAYLREKFRRGFDLIVDVFGADHIATIPDVLAGIKALGYDPEKVKVVIHQFVTLMRDGEQVKMSKRLANFVTLDELIDEVGPDAVRFFFLMRSTSSHLEFDLNLAKEQSEKNPVYYLQYAHARIASILRFAEGQGTFSATPDLAAINFDILAEPSEIALAKLLLEFPDWVQSTAMSFEPHRIATYLGDVATAFHKFYHEHRVVIPERDLAQARLSLCLAAKIVLANGFKILGISAPEKM
jgi:arginyl-tRNA synthetase